ncbi:MAG TPA: hypothetical protein VJ927_03635 [Actinomycetota bacterium]|nr:hypothetical protein [Actinomycetota bacterium]
MPVSPIVVAHGVGRVYESPLPVWLYLVGAAATVLISFAIRSVAERRTEERPARTLMGPRGMNVFGAVLKVAGLAVIGLLAIFAIADPDPGFTAAPLLFWVILIIGTTVASALVGGVWRYANPWRTIESMYRVEEEDEPVSPRRTLPWWVGPVLLYGLFWFELISGRGFDPVAILLVLLAYTLLALTLSARLGTGWELVDPLSILFGFASRSAPLHAGEEGLVYRGPLSGLDQPGPMPMALFGSVFVLLASTTLDNLRETVEWTRFLEWAGLEHTGPKLVETVALAALTLPFLVAFVGVVAISRTWLRERLSLFDTARRFAWSLIPIGIAYVLAHNIPLLIIGVPALLDRIFDTLGVDLFSRYTPSPLLVWIIEIVVVVGGHVLGVLAAHRAGVRMTDSHAAAVKSHVALTILMSFFTVSTLWLLSLALVSD